VWGLPSLTHDVLLPLLSQCISVLGECRRSLNYVRSCIRLESAFVQFMASHVVVHFLDETWYIVLSGSTDPLMI